MTEDKLPSRTDNFADWYNQLVLKAELVVITYSNCLILFQGDPALELEFWVTLLVSFRDFQSGGEILRVK